MTGRNWFDATREIARAQLSRRRRAVIGWSIALIAVCGMYVGFWPVFEGNLLETMVEQMPAGLAEATSMADVSSPIGWLRSTTHGLLGPLLLSVFGIGVGSRALADDERFGYLSIEASQPIARSAIGNGRLFSCLLQLATLAIVISVATAAVARLVGMDVAFSAVAAGGVSLFLFALLWLSLAWAIAASTGSRGLAVGYASTAAGASYVLHVLGSLLARPGMQDLSPYSWYVRTDALSDGLDPAKSALFVGLAAVCVAIAATTFDRRDLAS